MAVSIARHDGAMNEERPLNILLIEDNEIIGDALRDHVAAFGWTVDWVADLQSSLLAVDAADYGLVLLDLRLPDGSGLEFLHHLNAQAKTVPVIILSAYDQVSDRMQGMTLGAIDYLVKPFDLSELIARIALFAHGRQTPDATQQSGAKRRVA